jgi:predicted Zn-dependent protease
MFDGRQGEGRMNTTLRMKITVPASAGTTAATAAISATARAGGSTDPREFLAMRARQKQAQARARRWRLSFLALIGAGMIVAGLATPRWRHRVLARAQAATAPMAAPVPITALAMPTAPEPPIVLEPPIVDAPAVTASEVATAAESSSNARCDEDFGRRHWRAAIDSCAQAFTAAPDAAVAMKLAQAYWAHDEAARAGKWASRALALGSDDADAFVLIGHAEREAGDAAAAITAYRKYLHRAPYGWHAVRVRAAIRELKAAAPTDETASAAN